MVKKLFDAAAHRLLRRPARKLTTRQELNRLIADRKNDPQTPAPAPKPSWAQHLPDPKQKQMQLRERRIRFLQNRLEGAKHKMERDWDQSI